MTAVMVSRLAVGEESVGNREVRKATLRLPPLAALTFPQTQTRGRRRLGARANWHLQWGIHRGSYF